jgi:hypothetical protein
MHLLISWLVLNALSVSVSAGLGRLRSGDRDVSYCIGGLGHHYAVCITISGGLLLLYYFDQMFMILEILVSEKAEKFSFELRRILPTVSFFGRDA